MKVIKWTTKIIVYVGVLVFVVCMTLFLTLIISYVVIKQTILNPSEGVRFLNAIETALAQFYPAQK